MPLGYLAPVGLLLAIVVVGAYVTGYNRRDHEERARAERESAAALDAVDPLVGQAGGVVKPKSMPADSVVRPRQPEREASRAQQSAGGTTDGAKDTPITRPAVPASLPSDQIKPQRPAGSPTGQPERAAPVPTPPPQANNPAGARPKGSTVVSGPGDDPRQVGLNYLIAATLTADEAERAAQFLAGRGLEVAVVPADNRGPSRWVVVLEGLTAKELGSTRARALEQKIQDLGRVYKQEFKGPTVFNDPWWKKHTKDSGSGGADSGGE